MRKPIPQQALSPLVTTALCLAGVLAGATEAPPLQVRQAGSTVLIAWPTNRGPCHLESSSSLSPAIWSPVEVAPVHQADTWVVAIEPVLGSVFLRLREHSLEGVDPELVVQQSVLGTTADDSDGDGLPDAWELAHGLDSNKSDASDDPDRDGLNNLQEYLLNSDPKKSDLVGSLPGTAEVSSSGAGTYSLPIALPPGTAGMQPSLSLSYSSQGGNGLLGVRFALGGLSAISRCPKSIAQDGEPGGVGFDKNDRFSLDGQRLVLVSGIYGGDGAEYRTELESFSRIHSYGGAGTGPARFVVETRSGQIIDYGATADSRIEAQGRSEVLVWTLSSITDRRHNVVNFTYFEDTEHGEYYPLRIEYGGNRSAHMANYVAVNFNYQDRPDVIWSRVAGSITKISRRLSGIQTSVDGKPVLDYRLHYDAGHRTGRSRLTGVQECDSNGACLPATTFAWTDASSTPSFDISSPYSPRAGYDVSDNGYLYLEGDFNGDGISDLLHPQGTGNYTVLLSKGDGTFKPSFMTAPGVQDESSKFVAGDFDGSGRTSLFHPRRKDLAEMWLAQSNGTFRIFNCVPPGYGNAVQNDNGGRLRYYAGDWNGDGRTDLIHIVDTHSVKVWLSKGDGTFKYRLLNVPNYRVTENDDNYFPVDLNGDGRADLIHFNPAKDTSTPDEYWLWISQGDGSFRIQRRTPPSGYSIGKNDSNFVTGDWNGDGRTDLINFVDEHHARVWMNMGNGEFSIKDVVTDASFYPSGYDFIGKDRSHYAFKAMDWNADGRSDLLHIYDKSHAFVWTSKGDGTFLVSALDVPYPLGQKAAFNYAQGDFAGQGKSTLLHFANNREMRVWTPSGPMPDLVLSVTNGLGFASKYNYKPLTDVAMYSKGSTAHFPEQDVAGPLFVVASLQCDDGSGGRYHIDYKYYGAKAHLQGRGSLGFRQIESTDSRTGLRTSTIFRQDFPFIGQTATTSVTQASGKLVSRSINTWSSRRLPRLTGSSTFVWLAQSENSSFELDGTPIITTTTQSEYDDYGNATRVAVASGDGFSKSVINQYGADDPASWILNRLTQAEVTSSASNKPPQKRLSSFAYSGDGLLQSETVEPTYNDLAVRKFHEYDVFGNITNSTTSGSNILKRTVATKYDTRGRFAIGARNAMGYTEARSFDPRFGGVTSLTDINGLTTVAEYDSFGNAILVRHPDGTRTAKLRTRCDSDAPASAQFMVKTSDFLEDPTKPFHASITVYMDELNRQLRTKTRGFDNQVVFQDTLYDNRGLTKRLSRPYYKGDIVYWTDFAYDVLGRNTEQVTSDGARSSTDYNGLSTATRNSLNQVSIAVKDSRGLLVRSVDASGHEASYSYDAIGNLEGYFDANGNQSRTVYDQRGFRTSVDDPDLGHWEYRYNVRLLSRICGSSEAPAIVRGCDIGPFSCLCRSGSHRIVW